MAELIRSRVVKSLLLLPLLLAIASCHGGENSASGTEFDGQVGTVHLQCDCNDAAASSVRKGLALLHHMTYNSAEAAFRQATRSDPECALAYWGIAMTFIHPVWSDVPTPARISEGQQLLRKARQLAGQNQHELAYIAAAEAYYKQARKLTEPERLSLFAAGWRRVQERFPEDPEAKAFHALTHMADAYAKIAAAPPPDKRYPELEKAGAIAESILAKYPDHPGAHHYIIHAYDMEGLAERALTVARNYGAIAPDVAHALHMPTHIFTRLGFWDESIDWNTRSAAAALQHPHNGAVSLHYFHAIDYLSYAFLQTAQDQKALEMVTALDNLQGPLHVSPATAYALAAVPARYYLERHQWSDAARLELPRQESFPWKRFPQFAAITRFARVLGAARANDIPAAEAALQQLSLLRDQVTGPNLQRYWQLQIDIQVAAADGWLQYRKGQTRKALRSLRRAAELESASYKHPITPGEVLPARELLADLFLEVGRPAEALVEYQAVLKRTPGRFNSLFGTGRASEASGKGKIAATYYQELVARCKHADDRRSALKHARKIIENRKR